MSIYILETAIHKKRIACALKITYPPFFLLAVFLAGWAFSLVLSPKDHPRAHPGIFRHVTLKCIVGGTSLALKGTINYRRIRSLDPLGNSF